MAENIYDGNLYVYFLPAVADISAPTVAEITAGDLLSDQMKVEDLDIPWSENEYDNSKATSAFQATGVGTYGAGPITITLDDNDDKVLFDSFARGDTGFLLVSRHGAAVATSRVEVYPVECHGSKPMNGTTNDKVKFTSRFAVTTDPDLEATVAA